MSAKKLRLDLLPQPLFQERYSVTTQTCNSFEFLPLGSNPDPARALVVEAAAARKETSRRVRVLRQL